MNEDGYGHNLIDLARYYQMKYTLSFDHALALAIGYTQYAATKGFI